MSLYVLCTNILTDDDWRKVLAIGLGDLKINISIRTLLDDIIGNYINHMVNESYIKISNRI